MPDVALKPRTKQDRCLYEVLMAILLSLRRHRRIYVSYHEYNLVCRETRDSQCLNPRLRQHVSVTRAAKIILSRETLFSMRLLYNISSVLTDYQEQRCSACVRIARDTS